MDLNLYDVRCQYIAKICKCVINSLTSYDLQNMQLKNYFSIRLSIIGKSSQ